MELNRNAALAAGVLLCSILLITDAVAANPVANASELVAQHLDSIASPAIRAGLNSRVVQGPVLFRFVVGGFGALGGKAFLVSEGNKFQFMMRLPSPDYNGERFIFDGQRDSVALSTGRERRSALGDFVLGQDAVLREGLLGGVLSTAWPLLSLDQRKAQIRFEGLKKVEGQKLYRARYLPRRSTDLKIELYFDPETCRHVETVYTLIVEPTMVTSMNAQALQQQTRLQLQEKFSDFRTVNGVTLPAHYDIQFSRELQHGRTAVSEWEMTGLQVSNNMPVDSRNFELK